MPTESETRTSPPLAANVSAMFESFAQNGEDIILWRALGEIENGTYVDVGAADPDEDSVTKAFYQRGWRGINIEPAPEHAARLAAERTGDVLVQACAGEPDGSIVLHHVVGTGLSSVVDDSIDALDGTDYEVIDVVVPVRRLDEILADAGWTPDQPIHFLKIDVEGFEESVIRSIDLDVWRPWVIVAESTRPRSTEQAHHGWEPILLEHGYEFCFFDGLNRYYVASEHADLRPALSFPPGVFDQPYLTPPHAKLMREYDNLLQGHDRLVALHEEALVAYDERGAEIERLLDAARRMEANHEATMKSWRELEGEHKRVLASWETLEGEYHNVLGAWERLEKEHIDLSKVHAEVVSERDELSEERTALRDGISRMGAEFDQIRHERDAALRELELTRQTLSWRVTRPLRSVRRLRGA